jgi:hypothetical protein
MEMVHRLTEKASGVTSLAKSVPRSISEAAVCTANYIRKRGFSRRGLARMGRDLTGCVSKNPVQSMVALMAVGFVTGMLVRRR